MTVKRVCILATFRTFEYKTFLLHIQENVEQNHVFFIFQPSRKVIEVSSVQLVNTAKVHNFSGNSLSVIFETCSSSDIYRQTQLLLKFIKTKLCSPFTRACVTPNHIDVRLTNTDSYKYCICFG